MYKIQEASFSTLEEAKAYQEKHGGIIIELNSRK